MLFRTVIVVFFLIMWKQESKKNFKMKFIDTRKAYEDKKNAIIGEKGIKARPAPFRDQEHFNSNFEAMVKLHISLESLTKQRAQNQFINLCATLPFITNDEVGETAFSYSELETYTNKVFRFFTKNNILRKPDRLSSVAINEWLWEIGGLMVYKQLGPVFNNIKMLSIVFVAR